jgi:GTP-sensing pleiotropic transcriptional regulator CodY
MPELTYQKAILDACRKIGQILESASTDSSKSFEDCIPQVAQVLDDLVAADRRGCAKFILGLKVNHRQQKVRAAVSQMRQLIAKKILDTIAVQMPPIVLP